MSESKLRQQITRLAMRLILSISLLVAVSVSGEAATLSIEDAVNLALENNESYLVAKAELEKADAEVKNAVAGALPSIDFASAYTRNHEIPEVVFAGETFKLGTNNSVNLNLTLTQSIYKGGKVFAALKIARLYRRYSEALVKEAKDEVVFGVRQAFLWSILARNVVDVYQDAVATAQLNLELVTKMHEQGMVSNYEVLRAEVELANLKPQLSQAENQSVIALHRLKDLIGLELSDEVELEYGLDRSLVGQELNLARLNESALEHRGVIREKEYMQEISEKAIGVARSGYRPNISVQTGFTWSYQADDFNASFNDFTRSWATTLNLTMPIFDGFATSAEVKKARLDHRSARLLADQTRDQVILDVRDSYLRYRETADRLSAQAKTVEQADEGLRIARLRYQNGVGTQLEILSAETALTQAKTNYVQSTHDAAVAVFRLVRATGVEDFADLKE